LMISQEGVIPRFEQGYSAPMLVEESLLLQVTIFDTMRREQKHAGLEEQRDRAAA
jgi:hypothetical protein